MTRIIIKSSPLATGGWLGLSRRDSHPLNDATLLGRTQGELIIGYFPDTLYTLPRSKPLSVIPPDAPTSSFNKVGVVSKVV